MCYKYRKILLESRNASPSHFVLISVLYVSSIGMFLIENWLLEENTFSKISSVVET